MAPTAAARHKNTQDILDELDNLSQDLSQPKLVDNLDINPLDKPALTSLSLLIKLKSVKKNWIIAGVIALLWEWEVMELGKFTNNLPPML
jgi:hypothetical protein